MLERNAPRPETLQTRDAQPKVQDCASKWHQACFPFSMDNLMRFSSLKGTMALRRNLRPCELDALMLPLCGSLSHTTWVGTTDESTDELIA